MRIDVAFLPADIKETDLSDTTCIVLDIFRATTSIVTAMAHGCKTIVPVLDINAAQSMADQMKSALLAGERQSIKIEGFDFGNSPFEFATDKVNDRTIIMTTTNGTIAIKATEQSDHTLLGAFINAGAVCRQARKYGKDIMIVCAGTDRLFSLEDALCAGLLVSSLQAEEKVILTDSAQGVWTMYNGAKPSILEIAGSSRNGKRLYDMGNRSDVEYCLQSNVLDVVPQYKEGRITLV
ncbi:2-phosphosulfolactate phosphatase [Sporomusa acidovorans]|uniref:Probable 2-phosphosulfolactate phosphatase n=1 Tax=Sporomusa acidovorans (strain ATCC 49682 / DSM 3132 / Mol) TaxID=1123286 RepID=A0ABZ3J035_SPOA4|nr:2-phosphosulfolactate phosphatase [Sporomusa acidovorans]OZC18319.1 putative 2-phosphosulfolactate phosphatase [Sporomusa acidovorans DSM 3132]SDF20084.1 2-phosphosulfolactate phosphatase [Sporomusa acidovorans]